MGANREIERKGGGGSFTCGECGKVCRILVVLGLFRVELKKNFENEKRFFRWGLKERSLLH